MKILDSKSDFIKFNIKLIKTYTKIFYLDDKINYVSSKTEEELIISKLFNEEEINEFRQNPSYFLEVLKKERGEISVKLKNRILELLNYQILFSEFSEQELDSYSDENFFIYAIWMLYLKENKHFDQYINCIESPEIRSLVRKNLDGRYEEINKYRTKQEKENEDSLFGVLLNEEIRKADIFLSRKKFHKSLAINTINGLLSCASKIDAFHKPNDLYLKHKTVLLTLIEKLGRILNHTPCLSFFKEQEGVVLKENLQYVINSLKSLLKNELDEKTLYYQSEIILGIDTAYQLHIIKKNQTALEIVKTKLRNIQASLITMKDSASGYWKEFKTASLADKIDFVVSFIPNLFRSAFNWSLTKFIEGSTLTKTLMVPLVVLTVPLGVIGYTTKYLIGAPIRALIEQTSGIQLSRHKEIVPSPINRKALIQAKEKNISDLSTQELDLIKTIEACKAELKIYFKGLDQFSTLLANELQTIFDILISIETRLKGGVQIEENEFQNIFEKIEVIRIEIYNKSNDIKTTEQDMEIQLEIATKLNDKRAQLLECQIIESTDLSTNEVLSSLTLNDINECSDLIALIDLFSFYGIKNIQDLQDLHKISLENISEALKNNIVTALQLNNQYSQNQVSIGFWKKQPDNSAQPPQIIASSSSSPSI